MVMFHVMSSSGIVFVRDNISGQMMCLIAVTQSALVAIDCHSCHHVCDISFQSKPYAYHKYLGTTDMHLLRSC